MERDHLCWFASDCWCLVLSYRISAVVVGCICSTKWVYWICIWDRCYSRDCCFSSAFVLKFFLFLPSICQMKWKFALTDFHNGWFDSFSLCMLKYSYNLHILSAVTLEALLVHAVLVSLDLIFLRHGGQIFNDTWQAPPLRIIQLTKSTALHDFRQ